MEENTAPVKSPCISVCVLDVDDVCEGCYRTAAEITEWTVLDEVGKREVLRLSRQRRVEKNRHLLL